MTSNIPGMESSSMTPAGAGVAGELSSPVPDFDPWYSYPWYSYKSLTDEEMYEISDYYTKEYGLWAR